MARVKKRKYATVKVKNISRKIINLTYCSLKPGETGDATETELGNHGKMLEKVSVGK